MPDQRRPTRRDSLPLNQQLRAPTRVFGTHTHRRCAPAARPSRHQREELLRWRDAGTLPDEELRVLARELDHEEGLLPDRPNA